MTFLYPPFHTTKWLGVYWFHYTLCITKLLGCVLVSVGPSLCASKAANNLFPPVHCFHGPSGKMWPFFWPVRPSFSPDRFPGISRRMHGGNGLEFCMLMYTDHFKNWLDHGLGLLNFLKIYSAHGYANQQCTMSSKRWNRVMLKVQYLVSCQFVVSADADVSIWLVSHDDRAGILRESHLFNNTLFEHPVKMLVDLRLATGAAL